MREIRFRGIDIKTRKFVYGSLVNFSELNDCPQYEIYSIEKITKQQKWYKVYDVGQYTGLNDKNGVEIYEGDILGENPIGEVIFSKGEFLLAVGDKENYVEYNLNVIRRRNAIVGNIHENPELLEVK